MKRKIYKNICILSVIIILITTLSTLVVCYGQFNNQIRNDVKSEAKLIADHLNSENNDIPYLEYSASKSISRRITLIDAKGSVIYDNSADAESMRNHNNRPEILSARESGFGESVRLSDTLKKNTFYYAVLLDNGGVLRISDTTESIYSVFVSIIPTILLITSAIFLSALFLALKLTENIIRPINSINLDNIYADDVYDELLPFLRKITRQNKEIRSQVEQLKIQKDRLYTISEKMSEGLIVLDSAGMILSINESALQIFGLFENNVISKSFLHLTRDLDIIEHIKSALNGNNGTKEVSINNKTYELYYSPVFENNTFYGAILLLRDISERANAEKIRREFSANVSHELKTPITTILGYSQMINNGMAKKEDIKKFTMKIENEANRLISLIEDIIKLSALDEKDPVSKMQSVNLFKAAKNVIANLENQINEKNINVSIGGKDTIVKGNQSMLEELIYNLCDNSIKYNKNGGNIDIWVQDKKITVTDTGIGIAKENLDRIFERFYQEDNSRSKKVSGTGLGLSIVKHIAIFHNAEIKVDSEPGKGTTITVDFINS